VRSVDVVELLPDRELFREVDVVGVLKELLELELIGKVGALHVADQVRAPRLDVDVARALVLHMPMELGLEFMAVVEYEAMERNEKRRESPSWVIP
jgi:hypothetical protein